MPEAICENCGAVYKINKSIPKFKCICRSTKFKVKN